MQQLLLTLCALVLVTAHSIPSYAQNPVVLSASDDASIIELPLTANLASNLTRHTTVQLASPAQHVQNGVDYPRWLGDAVFSIKNRRQQRQAIVITAKRGNPTLSTELLLEFDTDGQKTFVPYTFLLDSISAFNGDPPPDPSTIKTNRAPDLRVPLKTPLIHFVPEEQTTPAPASTFNAAKESTQSTSSTRPLLRLRNKPVTEGTTKLPKAIAAVPVPVPVPASAPVPAASVPQVPTPPVANSSAVQSVVPAAHSVAATAPAPTHAAAPIALVPQSMFATLSSLSLPTEWPPENWPLLAGYVGGALLLLYIIYRVWKTIREKATNSSPIRSREKVFQATAGGHNANTIFGLNEKQAAEIHKKWLREKIIVKQPEFPD